MLFGVLWVEYGVLGVVFDEFDVLFVVFIDDGFYDFWWFVAVCMCVLCVSGVFELKCFFVWINLLFGEYV